MSWSHRSLQEKYVHVAEQYPNLTILRGRGVVATKVVGEFPEGLDIYDFEFKPGWNIEFKKNAKGKITGATWTGTLHPYEFIEFGMLGSIPKKRKIWSGALCGTTKTARRNSSPVRWVHGCRRL